MAYLDERPPARPQFRASRREWISGVVVAHTFEGLFDDAGPDTGAERGAEFIRGRIDAPGSYHDLGDSDSAIQLIRDDCEAYQVAVGGHNRHAWAYCFTCRTTDLHPADGWTHRAMAVAGPRIRSFWDRNGFCADCSARWLTNAQVEHLRRHREWCHHGLKVGGLTTHGQLQPADRSDAWTRHPFRAELEQLLVDAIRGVITPDVPEEDDMALAHQIAHDEATGQLWHVWGPAGQMPVDLGYLRNDSDVAITTGLYGASVIPGPQGALVSYLLEQTQKRRPGEGQALTLSDLDVAKVAEGIAFILAADGRPDAEAHAKATADELARRLQG